MPKKEHLPLVGAHMLIAGGMEQAIESGENLGCTAIQIFTHSNRQWHIKPLEPKEALAFKARAQASPIRSYTVHASYLINIASPVTATRALSVASLRQEVTRCHALGIDTLVLHPGSATDGDKEAAIQRVAGGLDEVLDVAEGKVHIALELMAGQGNVIGSTLEELAAIKHACSHKSKIRFCLDTCHAFAAGYAFATSAEYAQFKHQIDTTIGVENIATIHINDSAKPLGSRVDRHAHIGEGKIPLEAFRYVMNDKDFTDIPKILETPKDPAGSDEKNLKALLALIA